jgi:hypothetical protein
MALALWAGSGLCGCAGFWDEVTSREFRVRHLFHRPDPMVVLRESTDGDKRQKALLALREPKQYGGSDQEQDDVLRILTEAAVNDRQVICRVAAIQSLAQFKDPRAAQALENAYYQAATFKPVGPVQPVGFNAGSNFLPETATVIRCQAIQALGQAGQNASMELLVRVVKQPAGEGTEGERQTKIDERIAAARALGGFKHYQATEAARLGAGERKGRGGAALRESLQTTTGNRKVAVDAKAWRGTERGGIRTAAGGEADGAASARTLPVEYGPRTSVPSIFD